MTIEEMRAKKARIEKLERIRRNAEILYVANYDGPDFEEMMEYLYSKEEAGVITPQETIDICNLINDKYAWTLCSKIDNVRKQMIALIGLGV